MSFTQKLMELKLSAWQIYANYVTSSNNSTVFLLGVSQILSNFVA